LISYLSGKVIFSEKDFVIVDVGGVGFKVFLNPALIPKITKSPDKINLFCFLHFRENTLELYGFLSFDEFKLFELLYNISGIGPKVALKLSSFGNPQNLKKALLNSKEKFKGMSLGDKRRQKIILELSGKLEDLVEKKEKEVEDKAKDQVIIEALLRLGFKRNQIDKVISSLPKDLTKTQERLEAALKLLGNFKQ
jgi:holliday junction DNA helicase RuvA